MKNKHGRLSLKTMTFKTISLIAAFCSTTAFAIDLTFDPSKDAPSSVGIDKTVGAEKTVLLESPPTEVKTEGSIINNRKDNQLRSKDDGWHFKAPMIAPDKTPYFSDDRTALQLSEEKLWQENRKKKGKDYDENPLDADNYRVTIETEYNF